MIGALGSLAFALLLSPQDPRALLERWRAHYAAVERELYANEPRALTDAQRAARAHALAVLADYRARGEFTRQELPHQGLVPQFVDRGGRRCAVAEILHADGCDALVERVRHTHNTAWVSELAADNEFRAWLERSGLTLNELVRLQTPSYCGSCDTRGPGSYTGPPEPTPGEEAPNSPAPRGSVAQPLAPAPGMPLSLAGARSPLALDGWWTWWEFNKLTYLDPQGLEQRLERHSGRSPDEVGAMTDPLRTARTPLLLEALRDPDAQVRAAAALTLGRLARGDSVAPLTALLADPSQRVRESALLGLGASGTGAGARVLLNLLEQGCQREGMRGDLVTPRALTLAVLALALGRREGMDPGVGGAVALLAPRVDERLRAGVSWAACLFQRLAPDPALEAFVLERTRDRTASLVVRAAALEALDASTSPLALARLQDALFGRELELRRSAALALGRNPQAAASAILMTASELEAEPLARGFVLLALAMRGGAGPREVLLDAFVNGPIASEPWAALGLGIHARGTPDALVSAALLERTARVRSDDSRPALLLALGLAREAGATGLARVALQSAVSPRERGYAATALALLGGDANRVFLRERLTLEGSGFVRASIAQGLAMFGEDADAPSLFLVLQRLADSGLQAVTAASMGQLGSASALAGLDRMARGSEGSSLLRATALSALGVLLERGEPLALPDVSRGANFALYDDWTLDLFLLAL